MKLGIPFSLHERGVRLPALLLGLAMVVTGLTLFCPESSFASQAVNVGVNDNLASLVNQHPGSTTFSLAPGFHRLQVVTPKTGDVFVGQSGAILSGAVLLTTFSHSGSLWSASVPSITNASSYPGTCSSTHPMCIYPEDLFFNNYLKTRVSSLSAVKAGTWYLNYSTTTVYMGDNPAFNTVELSVAPRAFSGGASSVQISNLTIEKYAGLAQTGAIDGSDGGQWWNIQNNVIRYNHGRGITSGNGMYVANNNIYSNGQLGMGGGGTNFAVQSNQVSYNNYAGYSYYWEAGGIKFSNVQNVMIEYNNSHNNSGPGYWNDINSQFVTYNQNQASQNIEAGILTEISSNITIQNNYIWNDGFNSDGTGIWWGAGILVENSSNVSIYSNNVSNCMDGIGGILANRGNAPDGQPYLLQNVEVSSNTITQGTGMAGGIVVEGTGFDNSVFTSWNNKFVSNTFNLSTPNANYFYWMGQPLTLTSFLADLLAL